MQRQSKKGKLSVKIRVFEDRTYEYDIKTPVTTNLIKEKAGIQKGNSKSSRTGELSKAKLKEIAEEKMVDLNAHTVEQAMNIIAGSARSMGVKIVD